MHITVNIYSYLRYYLPSAEKFIREKEWDMAGGFHYKRCSRKVKPAVSNSSYHSLEPIIA